MIDAVGVFGTLAGERPGFRVRVAAGIHRADTGRCTVCGVENHPRRGGGGVDQAVPASVLMYRRRFTTGLLRSSKRMR